MWCAHPVNPQKPWSWSPTRCRPMQACVRVCAYVCMHVCVHVCMGVCVRIWLYVMPLTKLLHLFFQAPAQTRNDNSPKWPLEIAKKYCLPASAMSEPYVSPLLYLGARTDLYLKKYWGTQRQCIDADNVGDATRNLPSNVACAFVIIAPAFAPSVASRSASAVIEKRFKRLQHPQPLSAKRKLTTQKHRWPHTRQDSRLSWKLKAMTAHT